MSGVSLDDLILALKKMTPEEREIERMKAWGEFEYVTNIRGERVLMRKSR